AAMTLTDVLTETHVVHQRQLRVVLRNPVWVLLGLTHPVLYLALFGPLLMGGSVTVTLAVLLAWWGTCTFQQQNA
ncbi:MAG: hypothetical protein ABI808_15600, partial [Pseudonocardiales bacterium]